MKIHIKNGRVIDPISQLDSQLDVYIGAGKILALGTAPAGFVANQIIDASNLIVCPGLVDLSARLREPGEEYKATLISELQAAVAGGVDRESECGFARVRHCRDRAHDVRSRLDHAVVHVACRGDRRGRRRGHIGEGHTVS